VWVDLSVHRIPRSAFALPAAGACIIPRPESPAQLKLRGLLPPTRERGCMERRADKLTVVIDPDC